MQPKLTAFLTQLQQNPNSIEFAQSIALIDELYHFSPQAFRVGEQNNAQGQNQGSCKLLSFAKLQQLSPELTLALFGHFYRDEVLGNPSGQDHQNIRQFMAHGWQGVSFDAEALQARD